MTSPGIRPATVACLGPRGTFSEEALRRALGGADSEVEIVPADSNRDVVLAVENGLADAAFVPIENSVEGAVTETLDALVHEAPNTQIVGELVWPVHHCLIAAPGTTLDSVKTVASHPQALAQSSRFLNEQLASAARVNEASTAEAVRDAVSRGDGYAAIGSSAAADAYSGVVLADAIEDSAGNKTRFVWLAKDNLNVNWLGTSHDAPHKTSAVFAGFNDTSPGALVGILSEFADRSVNLSKIESRPERTQLGHYLFFVDIDGASSEQSVGDALAAVETKVRNLRVLGSYPAYEG
ncbi:MAG TPA: prephenate dehydratase [Solirubrobacterales bacterium]|jgi:prephenate dehydratase|nr:prephenate dehydratase [Solirubrobacterales bacterium]